MSTPPSHGVVPAAVDDGPGSIANLVARCGEGDADACGLLVDLFHRWLLTAVGTRAPAGRQEEMAAMVVAFVWRQPEGGAQESAVGVANPESVGLRLVPPEPTGQRLVEPLAVPSRLHSVRDVMPGGPVAGLSEREAEVLGLIAQGLSNKEIAEQCYLGINTVKVYIRNAYRKISVTRRSQAVAWAIRNGL